VEKLMLDRILFATDLSPTSKSALSYAAAVARKTGARITGAYLVDPPRDPSGEERQDYKKKLGNFFTHPELLDVPVEIWLPSELPREAVGNAVQSANANITMVAKHSRAKLESFFLGSETERFLGLAVRPIWIVPCGGIESTGWSPVVCGIDFHSNSRRALDFAIRLAVNFHSTVTAVHVLEDQMKERQEQLEDLLSVSGAPPGSKALVADGHPAQELLNRTPSDLIVLGMKGNRSGASEVLGSTANQVIRTTNVPVVIVP